MIEYIYYDKDHALPQEKFTEFISNFQSEEMKIEKGFKNLCIYVGEHKKAGICSVNIINDSTMVVKLISKLFNVEDSTIARLKKGLQKNDIKIIGTKEIYVQSLTDFMNITLSISSNEKIYRGQANTVWDLEPSFKRGKKIDNKEAQIYLELLQANHTEFLSEDFINSACNMQHYGIPTRLLDWTENSLHAVYFACVNQENMNAPGKVILVSSPNIHNIDSSVNVNINNFLKHKYLEDKEVSTQYIEHLASLSDKRYIFFKTRHYNERIKSQKGCFSIYFDQNAEEAKKIRKQLFTKCKEDLKNNDKYRGIKDEYLNSFLIRVDNEINKLELNSYDISKLIKDIEEIKDHNTSEKEIFVELIEFLKEKLFKVRKIDHRMDDILDNENTISIIIEAEFKEVMIKDLNLIGINSSTVYPDIQGLVSYLKEKY